MITVLLPVWLAFEAFLRVSERVRGRGGTSRDRGTRGWFRVGLSLAFGLTVASRSFGLSSLFGFHKTVGLVLFGGGLGLRAAAVVALGRDFRTTVEVEPGQRVVERGPFRWIRHPSYVGLLLITWGFGVLVGNVAAVLAVLLTVPPLVYRIRVEEAELTLVLGEDYRAYQARTARLIPGVW